MRRNRLPLVLGLIVAAAAAFGLFFMLSSNPQTQAPVEEAQIVPTPDPGVEIVVARADIQANKVITDQLLLELENITTSDYEANKSQYITDFGEVLNKLAVRDLPFGTRIQRRDLTEPGISQQLQPSDSDRPSDKAYAIRVDALTGVADLIRQGDNVDVVATFRVVRRVVVPGELQIDQDSQRETFSYENVELYTTKTIVQQAKVLKILKPASPETEEGQGNNQQQQSSATVELAEDGQPVNQQPANPEAASTFVDGQWILVIAINDQEAELLEYARVADARISLVLRGSEDQEFEQTIGATLDLLIAEFGVPLPQPESMFAYGREQLIPQPTRTPAPTRVP
jgi:pilus assembly protein CpaB